VSLPNKANNILNLILTNELPIKDGIRFLAPVDNSDHNVVLFSIHCNKSQGNLSYNQADYTAMRNLLIRDYLTWICLISQQVHCGPT